MQCRHDAIEGGEMILKNKEILSYKKQLEWFDNFYEERYMEIPDDHIIMKNLVETLLHCKAKLKALKEKN